MKTVWFGSLSRYWQDITFRTIRKIAEFEKVIEFDLPRICGSFLLSFFFPIVHSSLVYSGFTVCEVSSMIINNQINHWLFIYWKTPCTQYRVHTKYQYTYLPDTVTSLLQLLSLTLWVSGLCPVAAAASKEHVYVFFDFLASLRAQQWKAQFCGTESILSAFIIEIIKRNRVSMESIREGSLFLLG